MPYGRGGAGNIEVAAQQKAQIANDVEANLQAAEPLTDHMAASNQQYALSGRGGMGNYYSPAQLHQTGTFNDAEKSHVIGDGTMPPASTSGPKEGDPLGDSIAEIAQDGTRVYGRGGAGNFMFGASKSVEQAARKRVEEDRRKEQLSNEIEKGVQEALAMPAKAKVANSKSTGNQEIRLG